MIDLDDLKRLLDTDSPVLSLHLQTDLSLPENQATTPAWRIWLKNALRDLEAGIADDERATWDAARARALEIVDTTPPDTKSLVLFLGDNVERIYALPVRLPEPAAAFGTPSIAPLVWLMDEYEPYLVVLADSERAEFLITYLGSTEQTGQLSSDLYAYDFGQKTLMPRKTGPRNAGSQVLSGSHRDAFDDMIAEHVARFYREVADGIDTTLRQRSVERLILGGSEQSAVAIRDQLSDRSENALVGIVNAPVDASSDDLLARVMPVAQRYERQQEASLVESVIDMAKADQRGALGRETVLNALEEQRVELLIAPWPLPYEDLHERLPVQALRAGSQIELVGGQAAQRIREESGLAARLYYTI